MKFWKSLSPGLRDLLTAGAVLLILFGLGLMSGPARAQERLDLELPPHIAKQCQEAGGCRLVTERQTEEILKATFEEAYRLGQIAQAIAATAKQSEQGCDRKAL